MAQKLESSDRNVVIVFKELRIFRQKMWKCFPENYQFFGNKFAFFKKQNYQFLCTKLANVLPKIDNFLSQN